MSTKKKLDQAKVLITEAMVEISACKRGDCVEYDRDPCHTCRLWKAIIMMRSVSSSLE